MKRIKVFDREFELSLLSKKIQVRIRELADELSNDLKDKDPVFIGILNGSFMFAADLLKKINIDAKITFLKLESYRGTRSTGIVDQLIGLSTDISGKDIVIIEDIVDTGTTLEAAIHHLSGFQPVSIRVVTLLFKPDACKKEIHMDYIGFSIPNKFVIGYGLDYEGYGRKYEDIYTMVSEG